MGSMQKVLVLGLVMGLVMFTAQSKATVCPVTGYSAFYSMDVDGTDESGNGNNLTNNGADFSSGEYVSMVGSGYLSGGADVNDFSQKMTISLWMYGVSDNDSAPWKLAQKWGSGTRSYYLYYLNNYFHFEISDNGSNSAGHCNSFSGYYDVYDLKDKWTHVVVVFDGSAPEGQSNVFLYATPEDQSNVSSPLISAEASINELYDSPADFVIAGYRCRIDGYVMYPRALDLSEIQQLHDAGRDIIVPEPVSIAMIILGVCGFTRRR